jgi:hypothetical protein
MLEQMVALVVQILKSKLYLTYFSVDFSQLNDVITKITNDTTYTLRYSLYI